MHADRLSGKTSLSRPTDLRITEEEVSCDHYLPIVRKHNSRFVVLSASYVLYLLPAR